MLANLFLFFQINRQIFVKSFNLEKNSTGNIENILLIMFLKFSYNSISTHINSCK